MSDDDPKYYNAWIKVMNTDRTPRKLLCTWHVIKNWNIQGRSKLKNQEVRSEMKKEMRKILKETKIDKFVTLKEEYFRQLREKGETDFLKYLQKYYFSSDERIMMWAHCYQVGVGINTNMAIESLNKVLKHNKMHGNRNIRIEKLLDLLEELVDDKVWKRILTRERPTANNYQQRTTIQAHAKAEQSDGLVESLEFGKFKVKSTQGEKYYFVSYNKLCDKDCRNVYCSECKICIHRYECTCFEFLVRTTLCKHIHMVVLYERRSVSVPALLGAQQEEDSSEENLYIQEPSTSQTRYNTQLCQYLEEKCETQREESKSISHERRQEIIIEDFTNFVKNLNREAWGKLEMSYVIMKKNVGQESNELSKKRKINKQTYYPNKK